MEWTVINGAVAYNLYKNGVLLGRVNSTATTGRVSYTDNTLMPGVKVNYTVQAIWNVGGDRLGNISAPIEVTPVGTAPTNVRSTAESPTTLTVSWGNVPGVSGYRIFVNNTPLPDVPASPRNFTIPNLNPNTRYQIRVAGVWTATAAPTAREGLRSSSVNMTTTGPAPTGLRVKANTENALTHTAVTVEWQPVAGADGYHILKGGTQIGTVTGSPLNANNRVEYLDSTLSPGAKVSYTVRAFWNVGGQQPGTASAAREVTPLGAAPRNVAGKVESPTSLTVTWSPITGANATGLVSYNVYVGNEPVRNVPITAELKAEFANLTPGIRYPVTVAGVWTAPVAPTAREGIRSGVVNVTPTGPAPAR